MAITLMTGMPGHGKTLWTVKTVKEKAEKENREVYYHGIKELALPWILLDKPEDWVDCPVGSIIVLDECQKTYRMRGVGSQVPRHVSELETHRHNGLDIFLITQHPMLLDTAVRRLIDTHFHVKRPFGLQRTTIHESSGLMEKPDQIRKDAIKHQYVFSADDFKNYKSAEMHTVKAKVPMRIYAFFMIPVLLFALGYFAYSYITKQKNKKIQNQAIQTEPVQNSTSPVEDQNKEMTPEQYYASRKPRVSGLDFTAPMYDAVMTVKAAPLPVACIASKNKCTCYSQQNTKLGVPDDICRNIVSNGFFNFTKTEKLDDKKQQVSKPNIENHTNANYQATFKPTYPPPDYLTLR